MKINSSISVVTDNSFFSKTGILKIIYSLYFVGEKNNAFVYDMESLHARPNMYKICLEKFLFHLTKNNFIK